VRETRLADDGALDRLIGTIYEAGLDTERWQDVLGSVIQALGAHAGQLFTPDVLREEDGGIVVAQGIGSEPYADYQAYYCQHDVWKHRVLERGPAISASAYTDEMLITQDEWRKCEFWNDFLRQQDFFRLCGGVVHDGSSGIMPVAALACYRGEKAIPFGPDELRFLNRLLPHLRRALMIRARLHPVRQAPSAVALDCLAIPVLVLNRNAQALFVNHAAQELLAQRKDISLRMGHLALADGESQRRLEALLAHASERFRKLALEPCTVAIGNPTEDGLIMSITPAGRLATGQGLKGHAAAVVFLRSARSAAPINPRDLQTLYGLTAAEANLAVALAQGQSLEDYSAARGTSPHTVRSQLRGVFEKTGVTRQTELVRVLLCGSVPLRG